MIFSLVQRKKLQKAIEKALPVMKDCDHKQIFLVILALILDLAETENGIRVNCVKTQNIAQGYSFVQEIQKAVEEFQKIAAHEAEGVSLQHVTILAENMKIMSDSLFVLRDHLFNVREGPLGKRTIQ